MVILMSVVNGEGSVDDDGGAIVLCSFGHDSGRNTVTMSVLALLLLRGKTEEKRQDNGISKVRIRLYLTSNNNNNNNLSA